MGEPAIVVGNRKELTYLLSQAAELEHGLMCEYLYAAFGLKTSAGPGLRDDQLAAVERWRAVILGIAAEEMLHWAMVQNLLTAVGSAPYVSRPHLPHQAKGYPPADAAGRDHPAKPGVRHRGSPVPLHRAGVRRARGSAR